MSQVLEAPPIRDEERMSSTEVGISLTLPRSVMSFIRPRIQHMPEFAVTTRMQHESPRDRIYRTHPFLVAFSSY